MEHMSVEHVDVVVIGGGQAGLAIGYYLARRGLRFVILEAHSRVGDSWRKRWDSLRLFTFARYDALPGMAFPAPPYSFPTKDQMADYLEQYAVTFDLPVRTGVHVNALRRAEDGDGYVVIAGDARWLAPQVVVAAGAYHEPRVPDFARELKPDIRQLHSSQYRNPAQLRPGAVLVVGACNSGAEIAFDVACEHRTWLSGRDTGHIPINPGSRAYQVFGHLMSFLGSRLLTVDTPLGRKARPKFRAGGGPLIRVSLSICGRPAWSACSRERSAPATGCPSSTTVACSTWRTSSGAWGTNTPPAGSRSRSTGTTAGHNSSVASSLRRPGCTSLGCRSCTRSTPRSSSERSVMPRIWPTRSSLARRSVGA